MTIKKTNKKNDNDKQDIKANIEKSADIETIIISKAEYKELEARYLRAVADYHNAERRYEEQRKSLSIMANEILIEKLIVVVDDLNEASKHINDEGLEKLNKKLNNILESSGLEVIDPINESFDPNEHEAIESVDGKSQKVILVHKKGYRLGNKVLRPAFVAVGNGNA